ncbi:hypothetical protein BH10PSE4_BH10PSE4_30120 [soil metagenome]
MPRGDQTDTMTLNPASPQTHDGPTFTYVEDVDDQGGGGRSITFADPEVRALDYQALVQAKPHLPLTVALVWDGARVVATNIPGFNLGPRRSLTSTLISPYTSEAIGLVRGGWLPSSLAATRQGTMILLDRNVVCQIEGRFETGEAISETPDFIDLFAGQAVRINPMLFVLEGNARSLPTPELAQAQLTEVVDKLRKALPQAEIVAGPDSLKGALGLLADARPWFERHERFLLRIAPSLESPVGRRRAARVWREALAAAEDCGIAPYSIVMLAVLSALSVPNGTSPARDMLKFQAGYDAKLAYNALSDLHAIQLLINCMAIYPDQPMQLCTRDRGMALFWVGMGVADITFEDSRARFNLDPVEALLPGAAMEQWRAFVREPADPA